MSGCAEGEPLFRNLPHRANHVGLLAEEIDPSFGDHLGNSPQAPSRSPLINTAVVPERLRREGGAATWPPGACAIS